jgi:phospholipase D1/2
LHSLRSVSKTCESSSKWTVSARADLAAAYAGCLLFDTTTKLLSDDASAVGDTWEDLLLHTVNRGISITMMVADFDVIVGPDLHEMAWRTIKSLKDINEKSRPDAAKITVRPVLHPAKAGIFPRLMLGIITRKRLHDLVADISSSTDPEDRLDHMPGLKDMVYFKNGKVRVRWSALPCPRPVTLHHKLAVFDREIIYIGGLDLNERRLDDANHDIAAQDSWHDVQVVSHNRQVAEDACAYLNALPDLIDRSQTMPEPSGPLRVTLSRRRASNIWRLAPEKMFTGLLEAHLEQIGRAKEFIYLESQFFRDRRISKALKKAAEKNQNLQLIVLLPAAPEEALVEKHPGIETRFGEYLQSRALRRVRRAFGNRFLAVSPVQTRKPDDRDIDLERATLEGAPIIYVHSKLAIFDNRVAIVSSANLNGRSMKWDAEAGVILEDQSQVEMLTDRIFTGWLGEERECSPQKSFSCWTSRALQNAQRRPEDRDGFIVQYDLKAAAVAGVPVPGVPEELV